MLQDTYTVPLRQTDTPYFMDTNNECWIVACGRLLDENTIQCVENNQIVTYTLCGEKNTLRGYDMILLGRLNKDIDYIYVIKYWEPDLCEYAYDLSSPIPFIYIEPEKALILKNKKRTTISAEKKKKNKATEEIVNIHVKYLNKNYPPLFLLSDIQQSNMVIKKLIANGVQFGSIF